MRPYPFVHARDPSKRFFAFDMFETLVHNEMGTVLPMFEKLCTYYPGVSPEEVNGAYHDLSRRFKSVHRNRELSICALVHHLNNRFGFSNVPEEMEDPLLRGTGLYGPAGGALETLQYLRDKGYRIGVLSNTRYHSPVLKAILDDCGYAEYIDAVVGSADIGYRKPAPEAYYAILSALGCPKEHDCFFCGDNPSKDYYGPLAVGFKGAVHLNPDHELRSHGIITRISDLPGLFENPPQF